jgi:hypothetical protein
LDKQFDNIYEIAEINNIFYVKQTNYIVFYDMKHKFKKINTLYNIDLQNINIRKEFNNNIIYDIKNKGVMLHHIK